MAKYGRFDPRNKKKNNDKYRSEKRKIKIQDNRNQDDVNSEHFPNRKNRSVR